MWQELGFLAVVVLELGTSVATNCKPIFTGKFHEVYTSGADMYVLH